ncbi:hypothetical protein [Shimia sp. SDUM112013]|uniref:hypothetical protein n=1 Tax=Shimia sp. SDUM112013 TaxID=3136160 RepID=UPI0032ED018B
MQEKLAHPDNLTGSPDWLQDIANAMLLLSSPAASWVCGQTFNVHGDGGIVRLFGS